MTIRELRGILYCINDQDQVIEIDDIYKIIALIDRTKGIKHKIEELNKDKSVSEEFINGWRQEFQKAVEDYMNYKGDE